MKMFEKNEEAVSPVIGVILMVAITVILAAVIASFVFGMTGSQQKTPTASLAISSSSNSLDHINISHRGGDSIDLNKVKAIIEQGSSRMTIATLNSTTQTFAVGDEIGIWVNTGATTANAVSLNKAVSTSGTPTAPTANLTSGKVTVTLIDTDTSQQISLITATVS